MKPPKYKDVSTTEYSKHLSKLLFTIEEFVSEIGDAWNDSWSQEQIILCNIFAEFLRSAEQKGKWLKVTLEK